MTRDPDENRASSNGEPSTRGADAPPRGAPAMPEPSAPGGRLPRPSADADHPPRSGPAMPEPSAPGGRLRRSSDGHLLGLAAIALAALCWAVAAVVAKGLFE